MANMEDFHVDTWNIVFSEVHYDIGFVGIRTVLGHQLLLVCAPPSLMLYTLNGRARGISDILDVLFGVTS